MAISDKLNYLIETKQLFKDRLSSLGAEITASTTFRNYINWLNTFYIGSANKTDLAKNGVVGRTSQESTTGKNVFKKANDLYNNMRDAGQFTLADMGNNVLKATKNTTGTTSPRFYITDSIVSSTTYYVSLDALGNCNSLIVGIWIDGVGQTDLATITPTSNYQKISFSFTSNGNVARIYFRNTNEGIEVGQYFQIKNVMISTSSDTTYEPYTGGQPSPSPDYPQPINNLSGDVEYKVRGKNLFDKDNANILNAYFNSNIPTIKSNDSNRVIYIKCEANTTYTLSRLKGSVFSVGYTTTIPTNGTSVSGAINGTMGTYDGTTRVNCTITTGNNAQYLVCRIAQVVNDGDNSNNIINNLQIEENPTPTEYEPYISESFPLSLGDIELCDISDYKDRIYSQNGEFYLGKKTGKSILNGSENWLVGQYGTNSYSIKIANMKLSENNVTNPTYLMANLFKGVSYDDRTTGSNIAYSETTSLYIRNTKYTSLASFKAMLETTNLIVYYVLKTPTTTEITQENYPTLYSQLLAIQEFLTKYKINKEFLLDYSSPEIEY